MSKLFLENTRPHDIGLHAVIKNQIASVNVPASKDNPDDRSQSIHGRAEVDSELLEAAKKNPVVKYYFAEGWLREVSSGSDEGAATKAA